jgi:tetratricopeptide (TPR) repeat protein
VVYKKLFFISILTLIGVLAVTAGFAQPETDEQLAAQYFQNKEFDKAEVYYEKLFVRKPSYFYYSSYLTCLTELKEYEKAEKIIKKQVKLNALTPQYGVDLGYLYTLQEENTKAKTQFENLIKGITANKQYIIDLANAFLNRDLPEYAIQTYTAGRKVMKGTYTFGLELAEIYEEANDYDKMMQEYVGLIENNSYTYLTTVQNLLQTAISEDPDGKKSTALKTVLLQKIQKDPETSLYSEMLLWYSVQIKDFESAFIQAKSLDKRLKEDGKRVFDIARLAVSNKEYDLAVKAYQYIIDKGTENYYYLNSRMEILDARYLKITESALYTEAELTNLENEYIKALEDLGKSAASIPLIRNLAHLYAFYLDKTNQADTLLAQAIKLPNATPKAIAECKIELADIYLLTGEIWEATLLYSQVEKTFKSEPIGHEAKFKNAKLSYYIGDFEWAKTQLDILKAATSKLIANDALSLSLLIGDNTDADSSTDALRVYARADLLLFQNKYDKALLTLDSLIAEFPAHSLTDEVFYKKYEIYLKKKNIDSAAFYLYKIVENYPFDILADDALFKLAGLYENSFKDSKKAMELYEKLITDYPGSIYVVESRKKFRKLRGDTNVEQ